jgi:hypothetical protein
VTFKLVLNSLSETVDVVAESPIIDTTQAGAASMFRTP